MPRYLGILVILSTVVLLGAGCNASKPDYTKTPSDASEVMTPTSTSSTVKSDKVMEEKNNQLMEKKTVATSSGSEEKMDQKNEEKKNDDTANEAVVKPVAKTVVVNIAGFAFSPAVVKIKVGDTVKWINDDSAPHQVASNPHPVHTDLPGLESDVLSKGGSYSFTFDKAGTWGYHCHIHPMMTGTVVVE